MRVHPRRIIKETGLELIRAQAVRRVLAGENAQVVIRSLGFSRGCIYEWLRKFRLGGWEALKSRRITGRPRRLTTAQEAWVCDTMEQKNPLQFNFTSALWTRAMVATLIQEHFQIGLSGASVLRLLRGFGFQNRKPWRQAGVQDRALTERWHDYKQIETEARRSRAEILFLDVAACGLPGAPSGYVLSAVPRKGPTRFMVARGSGAAFVAEFIRRLLHGATRPVFLIVPAYIIHEESAWAEWREEFAGRLRLIFLPAAGPAPASVKVEPKATRARGAGRARSAPAIVPIAPQENTGPLAGIPLPGQPSGIGLPALPQLGNIGV